MATAPATYRHAVGLLLLAATLIVACWAASAQGAGTAKPNLLRNGSFERSLNGWRAHHAHLARIHGAARISLSGSRKTFALYSSPRSVSSTRAGAVYRATAWQRSATPGHKLCLRIREWSPAGALLAGAVTCRRSTRGWAPLGAVEHTARARRDQLEVSVFGVKGLAGESFDVDAVRLTTVGTRSVPSRRVRPPRGPLGHEACGWGTFSSKLRIWPGGCWRPYAATSPFNRPVPANAKIRSNSDAVIRTLLADGNGPGNLTAGGPSSDDYQHPVAYARSSDPAYTIHCVKYACDDLEGRRVRIPAGARPAGGGDGHLAVVDQSSRLEYDLYEAGTPGGSGGTLQVGSGGVARVDGSGLSFDLDGDGRIAEATAARFALLAGIVRAEELTAGRIDHALFITVPCGARSPTYVAPALKEGRVCPDNTNRVPMGARLRLNMSAAEIDALSIPRWKKTILRALHTYGAYMGDTGGPPSFGIMLESDATYTAFGATSRMVRFARANGWVPYDGYYVGKLRDGIPWSRLQLLDWTDPANH